MSDKDEILAAIAELGNDYRFPRAGRGRLPVPGRMTEAEIALVAAARLWLADTFAAPFDSAAAREFLEADVLKICSLISARYDGGWTAFAAERSRPTAPSVPE